MDFVVSPQKKGPTASDYVHLAKGGTVTIVGLGSLVSQKSARKSFEFTNFRFGTVEGYARIYNCANWINTEWGDSRYSSGEVCALAFAQIPGTVSRIALMDVPFPEGVEGFLHRETSYNILEVSYKDDDGTEGIALACGECTDDNHMNQIWGNNNWFTQGCTGRIWYGLPPENSTIPLVPSLQIDATNFIEGDPDDFLIFTRPREYYKQLPCRTWVYPSPGYMRLVYRAYLKGNLEKNYLEFTFLMDRKTNLLTYLDANPKLKEYTLDPIYHPNWSSDRYE
eukprot:TRINITY_DN7915_c0_g1_i2.p1 TRINITY_DN7915_c0_g1~~TRINITY_DN7915_c0_g1_i2.p1  ORF type:complete len:281 (-),score=38.15 TRINITY_DN7915_c0_g1_i2:97-939(-)